MKIFRIVTTVIMSAAFGFFGLAKILGLSVLTDGESWDRLGRTTWTIIGLLEVAAVISLLLALMPRFRALGVAAATGLVALTISALVFHVSNGDAAGDWMPALVQAVIAGTYATLGSRELRSS